MGILHSLRCRPFKNLHSRLPGSIQPFLRMFVPDGLYLEATSSLTQPADINTSTDYVEFFDSPYNTKANTYLGPSWPRGVSSED